MILITIILLNFRERSKINEGTTQHTIRTCQFHLISFTSFRDNLSASDFPDISDRTLAQMPRLAGGDGNVSNKNV